MSRLDIKSSTDVTRPLAPAHARRLINSILTNGVVSFSGHARSELAKDDMDTVDAVNVLRCGRTIDKPEPHPKTGRWIYRVHTQRMCVAIDFRSSQELTVVTAWRKKP